MTLQNAFVAYFRVSTAKQGASGLGLAAQREAVMRYTAGGRIVAEFTEIESGKKTKKSKRPELLNALAAARLHRVPLVVAKLDRLSRNAAFLLTLRDSSVKFVAADMPGMNDMSVGIMAVVAEAEGKAISRRTKEALAAARARGTKLGGDRGRTLFDADRAAAVAVRSEAASTRAAEVAPVIAKLQAEGATTLRALAEGLNTMGVPTARGTGGWSAVQVQRVMHRLASEAQKAV